MLALVATFLASLGASAPAGIRPADAATLVTAGYRDFQYGDPAAPGGDDVTAARNQSKLWFHDGRWFGVLFDNRTTVNAKFRIWRFDMATQDWTSTGVAVDDRNRSHADVLAIGNTLYVVSARAEGDPGTTGRDLRVYRYAYNAASRTYTLAAGFPKTIAGTGAGTGYATIAQETGRLWIAYPQGGKVRVTASTDSAATWSAPIDLPTMGNPIASDDVVAIAGMGGGTGVGVLWSNQSLTDDAFYFSAHVATDPTGTWKARETAPLANPGTLTYTADNHISLKTDASGDLIAAVKTGRDEDPGPNASDPLIAVFKRTGGPGAVGSWISRTVTTVALEGTRPVLVLNDQTAQAEVYLTYPTTFAEGQQKIHRRTAPLASLDFGTPSLGTEVIASSTETAINDATSTKQRSTASSGSLVVATNIPNLTYLHACLGGPCPVKPVADFTGTPTTGTAPLSVSFTDASTNSPTAWSWSFGDGTTSTARNPVKQYVDPGTYTVTLTASNAAGSSQKTRTAYIEVDEPPENLYVPIDPKRVLDTRTGVGLSASPFQANVPRTLSIAGANGIPGDAVAITGNLTVVSQTKGGFVSITKTPIANPTTSNLNFPVNDIRANGVTVPLNPSGDISIVYTAPAGATAHVLLDVTGYFRATDSAASFFALDPKRILDSRTGVGLPAGAFQANVPKTLSVAAANGIPADAQAITGNLTVVNQTKSGFVSITKTPIANPTTSNLNFPTGDIRANGVTVPLNASGDIAIVYKAPAGATAHVLLDVTGYFRVSASGASYVPLTPTRIVDTRSKLGLTSVLAAGTPRTFTVDTKGGIGTDAIAFTGNATVVNQTKGGFVSVTPSPVANPTTSTLNFPVGDIRANNFVVKVSAGGTDSVTYGGATSATTHFLVDVTGYYH